VSVSAEADEEEIHMDSQDVGRRRQQAAWASSYQVRWDLPGRKLPQVLKEAHALNFPPPRVRGNGHAPRPTTNTRRQGSRRAGAGSRAGPDDDPGEPREHLDLLHGGDRHLLHEGDLHLLDLEPQRAVAELRVRGERRVFEATSCAVIGKFVHAVGRWRQRTGPDHAYVHYSDERAYSFGASEA
jgi:hypothetical protein